MAFSKKQIENCVWLWKAHGAERFHASTLMAKYEHEWLEATRKYHKEHNLQFGLHVGTNRRHGFRRASGSTMERMLAAGLVFRAGGGDHGLQYYKLSPAGQMVAKDAEEAGT